MDSIQTIIENATLDLKTIENFVNLPEGSDVRPRLLPSVDVGTLAGIRQAIFETGGLPATPFATKSSMSSSALLDNAYAMVTDDATAANNGLYQKKAGVWVKSAYDPLAQSKSYTDTAKSSAISTAATDATTKANTAKSDAITAAATDATNKADAVKLYTDNNKLDYKEIKISYTGGNLIGDKTTRYINFGLSSGRAITAANNYDSIVLPVSAGDVLYIHSNNAFVLNGTHRPVFFADDPKLNQTQTMIAHVEETLTDAETKIVYVKIVVPANAKYLMFNTRYTSGDGVTNETYKWVVSKDSFVASFDTGKEVIGSIMGVPLAADIDVGSILDKASLAVDAKLVNTETLVKSTKNLFDPSTVILGSTVAHTNGSIVFGAGLRRTIKYPCVAGEWISLSGLGLIGQYPRATVNFWNGDTQVSSQFVSSVPSATELSVQAPVGATSFSLNINSPEIPARLQIEKSRKPTNYEPFVLPKHSISNAYLDSVVPSKSKKNLYDGGVNTKVRTVSTGMQVTSSNNDVVSSFIPVEFGKTYTISGLRVGLLDPIYSKIEGFSDDTMLIYGGANFVKIFTPITDSTLRVTIDNENVKYLIIQLSSNGYGSLKEAKELILQVEEGTVATDYEPYYFTADALKLYYASNAIAKSKVDAGATKLISEFISTDDVRHPTAVLRPITRKIAPKGISYALKGAVGTDTAVHTLYAKVEGIQGGEKAVHVNVMNVVNGAITQGKLKNTPFRVPSAQFDNPDSLAIHTDAFSPFDYTHPDIAYSATPVAGFKYWMIASVLASATAEATWEDEDLFVSNDAKTWQRVRSMYESDKSYTTATLRLPPQALATKDARRHSFLPTPEIGATYEISVPATNGAVAIDKQVYAVQNASYKHDPAILIDGGYVYTYHAYNFDFANRPAGYSRFIVCVRTNDGINWELVRSDGSTMLITEETSKLMFTKDAQGRYNYMHYFYDVKASNHNILKYGEGDYEFIYGANYAWRYAGATPYSFNFDTKLPLQDVGSLNHPTILTSGGKTYIVNQKAMYESSDRGVTFTTLPFFPAWSGGVSNIPYKRSMCIGEGGKLIFVDTQRYDMQSSTLPPTNGYSSLARANQMFIYEFASLAEFVNNAKVGMVDSYVDIQMCRVSYETGKRVLLTAPAVSITSSQLRYNSPLQRVKIGDMKFVDGDILYIFATLNSRNGGEVIFGGIDISNIVAQ